MTTADDRVDTYRDVRLRHTCHRCGDWIEPGTERIVDAYYHHDGCVPPEEELTHPAID